MGHRVTPSSPLPPSQLTETALILLLSSPSKPSPSRFPTQVKQQRSCYPVLFYSFCWYHDSLFRRPLTTKSCGSGMCYLYFCVNPEVRASTSQIQSHPASAIKEIRLFLSTYTPLPSSPAYKRHLLNYIISYQNLVP